MAVVLENGELDVIGKFKQLTEAALGTKSFYMRAKDTFRELFSNDKNWSNDYAKLATNMVGSAEASTTQGMMQLALQWAKEEKELAYSLALTRANIELIMVQKDQAIATTESISKDSVYKQVQAVVAMSASIRENGRISTASLDGIPTALTAEGTKYIQQLSQEASTYAVYADTYRKGGVVNVGVDIGDNVRKGLTADTKGYTWAQEKFALRQIVSFEESKRKDVVVGSSSMIGQLLSAETPVFTEADVATWRAAIEYLNTDATAV
jgi:hypothetical protein